MEPTETFWCTSTVRETHCPEANLYDAQGNFLAKAPAWRSYMWEYELPDRLIVRQDIHIGGGVDLYTRCEWRHPDGCYYLDEIDTFDLSLSKQAWKKEFMDKSRYN